MVDYFGVEIVSMFRKNIRKDVQEFHCLTKINVKSRLQSFDQVQKCSVFNFPIYENVIKNMNF